MNLTNSIAGAVIACALGASTFGMGVAAAVPGDADVATPIIPIVQNPDTPQQVVQDTSLPAQNASQFDVPAVGQLTDMASGIPIPQVPLPPINVPLPSIGIPSIPSIPLPPLAMPDIDLLNLKPPPLPPMPPLPQLPLPKMPWDHS